MQRVLIGGIGYRNLSDYSVGPLLVDELGKRTWPAHVVVEDISYGPIAVAQRLDDEPPGRRFACLIAVSAVLRGRPPGTIAAYRWNNELPPADAIQRAVGEAVTGVIAIDNTLVVCRHLGALPNDIIVVEVEPLAQEYGDDLSHPVRSAMRDAAALLTRLAVVGDAVARLPVAMLGGVIAASASTP